MLAGWCAIAITSLLGGVCVRHLSGRRQPASSGARCQGVTGVKVCRGVRNLKVNLELWKRLPLL